MIDIQNQRDHRNIDIDKVGVKNIRYPITVLDKANGVQQTVASVNMYVNLPHKFKGTHMSRFVEILNEFRGEINIKKFDNILDEMQKRLKAESAHLEIEFPYFIEKKSPVSRTPGLLEYRCCISGSRQKKKKNDIILRVEVPVTTVCPCSKEISEFGAHNQ
ncbi:MAG: GTP cyclohydrolase, FolE2/MptA family, partial [Desulfovibrionales bacterium]|nr:GTP cyclohydrolase, FolE2/MptA family [Desulfovibrionales bacterium]